MKLNKWVFIAGAVAIPLFGSLLKTTSVSALDEQKCLQCHGKPELTKTFPSGVRVSLYVKEFTLNTSAHRFIDCTTCHTENAHRVPTELTKLSLAQKCGSCHRYQYTLHVQSIHGEQLAQGNPDVATCVDCHSPTSNPHNVIRVLEYGSPAYPKNIAATCGKCHNDEVLMARYGIVEKVYESYMRSFHGKAIELGTYEISQLDKATCANCHGTHEIKSTRDPTSSVAGVDALAKTCESCHPGAGVGFAAGFLGHKGATPENFPAVHYAERFFFWFTGIVVAMGALLIILEIFGWLVNEKQLIRLPVRRIGKWLRK